MLDVEALLAPVADLPPCGPDLEYDPEWQELERLAQGKPEQQFGDTIIPAEEPEWRDVAARATALLARSKDVRSACLLARAQVHLDQFTGAVSGLQLILQLMERYWDGVHPQLDASDDNDPTMRLNALAGLADPQGLLRDVRAARLSKSRMLVDLSVRQVELAANKLTPRAGEAVPSQAEMDLQIAGALTEDAGLAVEVANGLAHAQAISELLDDKVGAARSIDMKPLITTLSTLNHTVSRIAAAQSASATDDGAGSDGASGGGGGSGANATSGSIRSRNDVVVLIDRICEFLQRTEPTNPAPLVLQRAKRLMSMNFMELMTDLAPDGIEQVRTVTGEKESSSE